MNMIIEANVHVLDKSINYDFWTVIEVSEGWELNPPTGIEIIETSVHGRMNLSDLQVWFYNKPQDTGRFYVSIE